MIPVVEVTLTACDNSTSTACGYVSISSEISEGGDYLTEELVSYLDGELGNMKTVTYDSDSYSVFSRKYLPQTCSTKYVAYRSYPASCDVCSGTLYSAPTPLDCDDDTLALGSGTAVTFASRHINTATKSYPGGLLSHVETHELTFSTRPALNSDSIVTCGSTKYKIKEVKNQDDLRKPLRAVAEITVRPRASV